MRKFILSLAALAAIGLMMPYAVPANAEETTVIHKDRDRVFPAPHRDHDKTIIIKKHHEEDRD